MVTCSTCKRIIAELNLEGLGFEFQDIKSDLLNEQQLVEMCKLSGSYQALFSRGARKYKELALKDQNLGEEDFKRHILSEYTFLKRPVLIYNNEIFIGNGKANIHQLNKALN